MLASRDLGLLDLIGIIYLRLFIMKCVRGRTRITVKTVTIQKAHVEDVNRAHSSSLEQDR